MKYFTTDCKGDLKKAKLFKWPQSVSAADSSREPHPDTFSKPERHFGGTAAGREKESLEGCEKCLRLAAFIAAGDPE